MYKRQIVDNYHGDTSRMFYVGEVSVKAKKLVDTTYQSMINAIKILKPGIRVSIPFGKQRNASGVIISINSKSEYPYHKLKKINLLFLEPL